MVFLAAVPNRCRTFENDNLHTLSLGCGPVMVDANPVYWRSTTVKRKIDTILDGEVVVSQWGYNIGRYIQDIAVELSLIQAPKQPVLVLNDNNANVTHVRSTNRHANPRLNSIWGCLRDSYHKGSLCLRFVCGKFKNVADGLTKFRSPLTGLLQPCVFRGKIEVPP